jgi:hypothetical protein
MFLPAVYVERRVVELKKKLQPSATLREVGDDVAPAHRGSSWRARSRGLASLVVSFCAAGEPARERRGLARELWGAAVVWSTTLVV